MSSNDQKDVGETPVDQLHKKVGTVESKLNDTASSVTNIELQLSRFVTKQAIVQQLKDTAELRKSNEDMISLVSSMRKELDDSRKQLNTLQVSDASKSINMNEQSRVVSEMRELKVASQKDSAEFKNHIQALTSKLQEVINTTSVMKNTVPDTKTNNVNDALISRLEEKIDIIEKTLLTHETLIKVWNSF